VKRRIVKKANKPWSPKATAKEIPCPACSGNGHHIIRSRYTQNLWVEAKCDVCKGTGVKT